MWYFARGRQKVGPVSFSELQQMVTAGELGPADMLLPADGQKWVTAGSLAGLFPHLSPPPVAAVPVTAQRYWLMLSGQSHGPYTSEEVNELRARHPIANDTLVCPEGGSQWVPITAVPDLQVGSVASSPEGEPWWRRWKFSLGLGGCGLSAAILLGWMLHMRRQRELLEWRRQELQRQQRPLPGRPGPLQRDRPLDARSCTRCFGSGKVGFGSCPVCEGRGWLPPPQD